MHCGHGQHMAWNRAIATAASWGLFALITAACNLPAAFAQEEPQAAPADSAPADAAEPPPARGRLIRIPLPITGNVDRRVEQAIRRAIDELKPDDKPAAADQRPTLVLEFDPGQTEFGRGSEFEDSLKLARFLVSPALDGIRTVAYVPESIKGHAVLVAIACEQIVMAANAEMGDAGADHSDDNPIDETVSGGYKQIARSRRTVPVEVAQGMLDASLQLLRVETEDGPQFVLAKDLDELRKTRTIADDKTQVIFGPGVPGVLNGRQAVEYGIAAYLAEDRDEAALHLGLSRKAMRADPFLEADLKPRVIMFDRSIDARLAQTRISMIEKAISRDGVNFVCLWIDSPGGNVNAGSNIASYLADLKSDDVLTVAYIPQEARGIAALVALSCDEVVMYPRAKIGGGEEDLTDEQLADLKALIDKEIAPKKSRSPALLMAMFKNDVAIHEYENTRSGVRSYFSINDFEDRNDKDQWKRSVQVTEIGEPVLLSGDEADELGLTADLVDGFDEFKEVYGLEDDPEVAAPNWADHLVRALANPALASLLILIGLGGMYAEIQAPGIGIGGFIAAVAFTLYFWANFMDNTASELEIVLFLFGLACLALEIFIIPGFGIFGLGGGVMIFVSLVLASQTFVLPSTDAEVREFRDSLLVVGGAIVGMIGVGTVLRRYLPHAPVFNKVMLTPPEGEGREQQFEREAIVKYDDLIGETGVTTTQLTPSGKARLNGQLLDVISDGDLIPIDVEIEVVEVHGNRVIVKAVAGDQ